MCIRDRSNAKEGEGLLLVHTVDLLDEGFREEAPVVPRVEVVQDVVPVLEGLGVVEAVYHVVRAPVVAGLAALHELVLAEISVGEHSLGEEEWHDDAPGGDDGVPLVDVIQVAEVDDEVAHALRRVLALRSPLSAAMGGITNQPATSLTRTLDT